MIRSQERHWSFTTVQIRWINIAKVNLLGDSEGVLDFPKQHRYWGSGGGVFSTTRFPAAIFRPAGVLEVLI